MTSLLDLIQVGEKLITHVNDDKFKPLNFKTYGYIDTHDEELFSYGEMLGEISDINNKKFYKFAPHNYYKISKYLQDKIYDYKFNPLFYLKDNKIEFSDNVDDYRIWYWDIETIYSMTDNKVSNPKMPITSISIFDSIKKEYYVISWHEKETADIDDEKYKIEKDVTDENENVTYIYTKNEKTLLKVFISLLRKYKPILLLGWFSNFFDLPYTIARLEINGIDTKYLSPLSMPIYVRKSNDEKVNVYIKGMYSIELNEVIDTFSIAKFASKGLGKVASELGLGDKLDVDLDNDYKNNFKYFVKYNINDVRLTYKIDKHYSLSSILVLLHSLSGASFNDILHTSKIVESALILNSKNAIIPSKKEFKNYQAATVLNPLKNGLLKNLLVIDANSMYPTSTITFNISPDTIICSYVDINEEFRKGSYESVLSFIENKTFKKLNDVEHDLDIIKYTLNLLLSNDIKYITTGYSDELNEKGYIYYHHDYKLGVYTIFLKRFYDLRAQYKSKKKAIKDILSILYSSYSAYDLALKLILNATYGANGYENFILYDPRIAETITFFARRLLEFAKNRAESKSYDVQYGDTDSLFIILKTQIDDKIKAFEEGTLLDNDINDAIYENHTKKYISSELPKNLQKYLGFKVEHVLHYVYFTDVKKRYYGLDYPDDNGIEQPYVRGMNVIRKDSPNLIKQLLNNMINKIIHNEITIKDFDDAFEKIKLAPLQEIGIIKNFNKLFSDYKVEPQHLKGLKFAKEFLNVNIANSDSPFLFYVTSNTNMNRFKSYSNVICLNEEDLDKFKSQTIVTIDYQTLFIKQVLDPLEEFNYIKSLKDILYNYKYRFSNNILQSIFNF